MSLKYNNTSPTTIIYNGTSVNIVSYNGTNVWGKPYTLTINKGNNTNITVNRTSSPNQHASIGNLASGSTIYYGDVLQISATANSGYNLSSFTVNGNTFTSNNTVAVSSNVTISTTAVASTSWKTVWTGSINLSKLYTIKSWNTTSMPTAVYDDHPILTTSDQTVLGHLSASSSANTRITGKVVWKYTSPFTGTSTIEKTFDAVSLVTILNCTNNDGMFDCNSSLALKGYGSKLDAMLVGGGTTYYGLLCELTEGSSQTNMMGNIVEATLKLDSFNITKIERYY